MQMTYRFKPFQDSGPIARQRVVWLLMVCGFAGFISLRGLAQQPVNPAKPPEESQIHSSGKSEGEFDWKDLGNLDIEELTRGCLKQSNLMHKQMLDYTYNLKKRRRTLNEHGKEVEKEEGIFEAYPVKGEHVLITLSRNGRRLPFREMEFARKIAGRELERKAREEDHNKDQGESPGWEANTNFSAGIQGKYRGRNGQISINPADFFRLCELSSPTLKQIKQRDYIVFKFRPRPFARFPYPKAYLAKLVGEIWIDAADRALVRLEGWPSPEYLESSKLPKAEAREPVLIFEQKRQKDGNWFPAYIRMNSAGDQELFNGLNWDVELEFTDYKRFNTGIGDVKVKSKEGNEE